MARQEDKLQARIDQERREAADEARAQVLSEMPKNVEVSDIPEGTMYAAQTPTLQQLAVPLLCGVAATYAYKKYPPFTSVVNSFLDVLNQKWPLPQVQCSTVSTGAIVLP